MAEEWVEIKSPPAGGYGKFFTHCSGKVEYK